MMGWLGLTPGRFGRVALWQPAANSWADGRPALAFQFGDTMVEAYDPRYLRGIESFNRSAYFDAHEEWESLWQDWAGADRTFYQGLIQVAVCLHHVGRRNMLGATKLYRSSRDYLRPYRPWHAGLDVDGLLKDFQDYWSAIEQNASVEGACGLELRKSPQLTLTESPSPSAERLGPD